MSVTNRMARTEYASMPALALQEAETAEAVFLRMGILLNSPLVPLKAK